MSSTFGGARVEPSGSFSPGAVGSTFTGALGATSPAVGGGLVSATAAVPVPAPTASAMTRTRAAAPDAVARGCGAAVAALRGFIRGSPLRQRDLCRRHRRQFELHLGG